MSNGRLSAHLRRRWPDYAAGGMAALFTAVICWMTFRQYATFQLRAPDVATFGQAIWNTLHGRFLFATTIQWSILAYHFSPFLALLSPLLLLWSDIRVLFVAQTVGIAAAGLILYLLVRREHRLVAPLFLAAFYLNPAVHELALLELRRVTFAIPFTAVAMYGLATRRYRLMSVGLFLALLCKENLSILVAAVGLFLLFRRDWAWGMGLLTVGITWALVVTFCVIPSLHPAAQTWACTADYPQLNVFSNLAEDAAATTDPAEAETNAVAQLIAGVVGDPLGTAAHMFDADGRAALWRVFLPLGLLLPFIAADWLLLAAPVFGLLLLSGRPTLHTLHDWYLAPIIAVLWTAVAVALMRLHQRNEQWVWAGMGVLVACTAVGYRQYSLLPGGAEFIPVRYELIDHHRLAAEAVAAVPPDAGVAAQDAFVSHLTQRPHLYLYPWYKPDRDPVTHLILSRHLRHYPFTQLEIGYEIDNLVAEPRHTVVWEADGIYLLAVDGEPLPAVEIDRTAEQAIHLEKAELAVADERGIYRPWSPPGGMPIVPAHGRLRVSLYWEALAEPVSDRTVSVRLAAPDGRLLAQHDMQPSKGARPTSWWESGWYFRDVYYLDLDPAQSVPAGTVAQLQVRLYDSYSQVGVPFADGPPDVTITAVQVGPDDAGETR